MAEQGTLIGAEPEQALIRRTPTPLDLLQVAMDQKADIDKLTKLFELNERYEANEARKAYNAAMTEFKKHPPQIDKNKKVGFGSGDRAVAYTHATLDHICDIITAALATHGITHRWKVEQSPSIIRVTCVLRHESGHEEGTTLEAGADGSGSKNGIQAIGSTVTYLQRYTLLAATGLATKGADDDASGGGSLGEGWIDERAHWIKNCRNRTELKTIFTDAYTAADKAKDKQAMSALIKAKNDRYKELPA